MTIVQSLRPGQSVTLSCRVQGIALSWLHWIRQKPGKGLEWIGRIDDGTGTIFAQSLQGQFSITKDTSQKSVNLVVNSLKQEDSAVYYCAREPQTTEPFQPSELNTDGVIHETNDKKPWVQIYWSAGASLHGLCLVFKHMSHGPCVSPAGLNRLEVFVVVFLPQSVSLLSRLPGWSSLLAPLLAYYWLYYWLIIPASPGHHVRQWLTIYQSILIDKYFK
uniref:Immunoglobulin heavy variable 1-4 n=1 Tax=Pundamilia nyererei TaxID=303518 RepID=A0A3B4H912_9CICH